MKPVSLVTSDHFQEEGRPESNTLTDVGNVILVASTAIAKKKKNIRTSRCKTRGKRTASGEVGQSMGLLNVQ